MEDRNQDILKQYNVKIYNTYRIRGAFILETDKGLKLLKALDGSKNRVEFENQILQHLSLRNYDTIDQYVLNSQNEIITEDTLGNRYIMKNWHQGEEFNLRDEKDVYESTRNLALIHSLLRDVDIDTEQFEFSGSGSLMDVYEKRNRELKRVRSYIKDKRKKNDFENCYLACYEEFYNQALEATNLLSQVNYVKLEEKAKAEKHICHGNYTYHNIIKINQSANTSINVNNVLKIYQPNELLSAAAFQPKRRNDIATTNFDKAYFGIQIMDLYHFMRKVLEKNEWDVDLGSIIIDTYETIVPISDDELRLLHVLFSYPEKFWKISNFYHNSKKSWVPQRNIQKLLGIQEQMGEKSEFLRCLLGSIN